MRKWQKIGLTILMLAYLIPLLAFLVPNKLNNWTEEWNRWLQPNWHTDIQTIFFFYALVLIALLVLGLVLIIVWPKYRDDVVLSQNSRGRLALDNKSLSKIMQYTLAEHGLQVKKIHLTHHKKVLKAKIKAVAPFQAEVVQHLPDLKALLDSELQVLLAGTAVKKVNTQVLVTKGPQTKQGKRVV